MRIFSTAIMDTSRLFSESRPARQFVSGAERQGPRTPGNRSWPLGTGTRLDRLYGEGRTSLARHSDTFTNVPRRAAAPWAGMGSDFISPASRTWFADELRRMAALPDNWDGYGSPRITRAALDRARRILATGAGLNAPRPYIGPVTGGGIQTEWDAPGRALEIEVLPDGSLESLRITEDAASQVGALPSHEDVVAAIRWLVGQRR